METVFDFHLIGLADVNTRLQDITNSWSFYPGVVTHFHPFPKFSLVCAG